MKKHLLTIPQAAERLNISVKKTWRMVYAKQFEVVRIGRLVRITDDSIDAVIDKGTTPPIGRDDYDFNGSVSCNQE